MTEEEIIRAGGIAHAIRLGKCPKPGMVMGFTMQRKEADVDDPQAITPAVLESARVLSEARSVEFVVTEEDIRNAVQLIIDQQATYREPKTGVPVGIIGSRIIPLASEAS